MATSTYNVTMFTSNTPIYSTGAQLQPFKLNDMFSAATGTFSQIKISDDDETFGGIMFNYSDPTGQTLAEDITLNGTLYKAGIRMASYNYTRIEELENGQPTGNFFNAMFPRHALNNIAASPMGGQLSVLIFPVPRSGPGGTTITPVFDRSATYVARQHLTISSTSNTFAYEIAPPAAAPCFTPGTLIECDSGPRRIETIRPGDLVRTRDNGLRRVRWIGEKTLDASALDVNPALRPIRIRAGALGNGLPRRDLTVSPQHRVLAQSSLTRQLCGETQVLAAAKRLTDIDGIEVVRTAREVTYWHMLLDGHELVRSNGAWTETLYTGPEAIKSLAPGARREILSLFPELRGGTPISEPARPILKGRDGRRIARHHARQNAELVEL